MSKRKTAIYTRIAQQEVFVLGPDDWEFYEQNRPSGKWELVEYKDIRDKDNQIIRVWVPAYALVNSKISDFSAVKIVNNKGELA